jgi:predicted HTH domain antitoxin
MDSIEKMMLLLEFCLRRSRIQWSRRVVDLYRKEKLKAGRAAEILGVSLRSFLKFWSAKTFQSTGILRLCVSI